MLTAGALALAVITPVLEQAERGPEAVTTPLALPVTPELADQPRDPAVQMRQLDEPAPLIVADPMRNRLREIRFDAGIDVAPLREVLRNRTTAGERVSRANPRRAVAVRPATRVRPIAPVSRHPGVLARPMARPAERPVIREPRIARPTRAQAVRLARKRVVEQRITVARRGVAYRSASSTAVRRLRASGGSQDMRAVIAFARAQLGKRYVRGGEGPYGFDCSGFTKRAYARAGVALPHSSGAQARRARSVSRSQARPGDLVVGPGHVGIYMGRGMMIDAGNHRTGVVYRKLYRGLSVSRLD